MVSRKEFIKKTAAATLAGGLGLELLKAQNENLIIKNPNSTNALPLIISTWRNLPANEAGMKVLMEKEGKALDAVEACAKVPEADPEETTVGYGGAPDRDGHVTLDACIMDHHGNAGSVSFLEHIMHPTSVARRVMEKTPHVMLCGEGALQFALSEGFQKMNLLTEKSKKAWEEWKINSKYEPVINIERHDTIGMLAIDQSVNIAGACSTSGMAYKMHGRVGDSPVLGAGMYVDNEVGGACATGLGEFVLKTLGSYLIVELMRQGKTPQQACEEAIGRIAKRYDYKTFQVGYLAINMKGEHGAYSVQKGFSYTLFQDGQNNIHEADYYNKT